MLAPEEIRRGYERFLTPEEAEAATTELMKKLETNAEGLIDFSEFCVCTIDKSVIFSPMRIKMVFQTIDRDRDGFVNAEDITFLFSMKNEEDRIFLMDMLLEVNDFSIHNSLNLADFTQCLGFYEDFLGSEYSSVLDDQDAVHGEMNATPTQHEGKPYF